MSEVPEADSVTRRRVADKPDASTRQSSDSSLDDQEPKIPPAKWTFRRNNLPQTIAHRGYKASFPENTMGAFRGAVDVGAHAIETDVHLSKDNVVVISHDPSLKRCYGEDRLVKDCDWAYLSTLKTLRAPHQPMPRLADLLAYLAEPAQADIWLLLDIKIDDDAELMISLLASTLRSARVPAAVDYWQHRVVLGCWTARHLRLCHELLPDYAIAWIGITLPLAREYLRVPNVALNMRQEPLAGVGGRTFMRDVRRDGRPLYAWTVNAMGWMRWAIGEGLDAVITDDPRLFLEVCERYKGKAEGEGKEEERRMGLVEGVKGFLYSWGILALVNFATWKFGYYKRVGGVEETREVLRKL